MTAKSDPPLSREREEYLRKRERRRRWVLACQWGFLLLAVALWEVLARVGVIDSFILSQPSRIWRTWITMFGEGELWLHLWVTVYETLVGFLLGVVLGVALAVLLWWSDFISRVSEPYLVVLPVIISLVGAGTEAIIFMALAISLIVTVLEMLGGFRRTDPDAIRMAATFGATKGQIFRKIVFPSNVGTLFGSLKINIGLSLVGVIAGEFLVSKAGRGCMIL